jgi:endonuclease YncB( thermonuclease family)
MGRSVVVVLALVALVIAGYLVFAAMTDDPPATSGSRAVVTEVVDGDTVVIDSGQHVRLIGVDTPERDTCGYQEARYAMRRLVEGRAVHLVNPGSVQDRDAYGRLLRFVDVGGRDAGLAQIRAGRAVARFDSRDGYDPHPREDRYRRADQEAVGACER